MLLLRGVFWELSAEFRVSEFVLFFFNTDLRLNADLRLQKDF